MGDARRRRADVATRRPAVAPGVRRISFAGDARDRDRGAAPAATTTARRSPCSSTPTAGRTAARSCRRTTPTSTSQWFADQGFAVVVVDGRGTPGPRHGVGAGRPPRPRHARARRPGRRAARTPPRCTPSSTSAASPSAAGASAATSPRSPSCAGPTSSTPPSPAHPSPSGGSTTRTTPSATSATRASEPDVYDASSLLPLADGLTRPLLLVHGLADDNVVAAHTLQLSSALLAAGRPHEVLPLVGHDAHDAAGGRRREPAAAPARLPATFVAARPPAVTTVPSDGGAAHRALPGVAVHATADREHMAALELLAVVMLADHHLSDDELDVLRSSPRTGAARPSPYEQYLGQAMRHGPRGVGRRHRQRAARLRSTAASRAESCAWAAVLRRPRARRRRRRRDARGGHPPLRDRRPLRLTLAQRRSGRAVPDRARRGRDRPADTVRAQTARRDRVRSRRGRPRRGRGRRGPGGSRRRRSRRRRAGRRRPAPGRRRSRARASHRAAASAGASATSARIASRPSGPANSACVRLPAAARTRRRSVDPSAMYGGLATATSSTHVRRAGRRTTSPRRCARWRRAGRCRPGSPGRRRGRRRSSSVSQTRHAVDRQLVGQRQPDRA